MRLVSGSSWDSSACPQKINEITAIAKLIDHSAERPKPNNSKERW
jgi:hypothetical protein